METNGKIQEAFDDEIMVIIHKLKSCITVSMIVLYRWRAAYIVVTLIVSIQV